jgi:DNA-binding NtrC family response regulator
VIERCVLFAQEGKIDREVMLSRGLHQIEDTLRYNAAGLSKQYREAKKDFDRLYFTNGLQRVDYNVAELAKISGMNRAYIYQKIKELGLELP